MVVCINGIEFSQKVLALNELSLSTNLNCQIPLQLDVVNLWYFKFKLFDPTEFKV